MSALKQNLGLLNSNTEPKIFVSFQSFVTRRLLKSVCKRGGCQPVAWTVMSPLWSPVGLTWRFLPTKRLRYAPTVLLLQMLLRKACGSDGDLYIAIQNEILLR